MAADRADGAQLGGRFVPSRPPSGRVAFLLEAVDIGPLGVPPCAPHAVHSVRTAFSW